MSQRILSTLSYHNILFHHIQSYQIQSYPTVPDRPYQTVHTTPYYTLLHPTIPHHILSYTMNKSNNLFDTNGLLAIGSSDTCVQKQSTFLFHSRSSQIRLTQS